MLFLLKWAAVTQRCRCTLNFDSITRQSLYSNVHTAFRNSVFFLSIISYSFSRVCMAPEVSIPSCVFKGKRAQSVTSGDKCHSYFSSWQNWIFYTQHRVLEDMCWRNVTDRFPTLTTFWQNLRLSWVTMFVQISCTIYNACRLQRGITFHLR
jgi:hypothetical protein